MEDMKEKDVVIIDEQTEDMVLRPVNPVGKSVSMPTIHKMVNGKHMKTNKNYDKIMGCLERPTLGEQIKIIESGLCTTEVTPPPHRGMLVDERKNIDTAVVAEFNVWLTERITERRLYNILSGKEVGARIEVKKIKKIAELMRDMCRKGILIEEWKAVCERLEVFTFRQRVITAKKFSDTIYQLID